MDRKHINEIRRHLKVAEAATDAALKALWASGINPGTKVRGSMFADLDVAERRLKKARQTL